MSISWRHLLLTVGLSGWLMFHGVNPAGDLPGQTQQISLANSGQPGNEYSRQATISANGQVIAFHSLANNLLTGDGNNARDVFVYDLQTAGLERVSLDSSGQEANNHSDFPALSATGRYVAFHSLASNLVADDTNNDWDVFVRDRQSGLTEQVSLNSAGLEGNALSFFPDISADGRYVAFYSLATNLVSEDTNNIWDVFVRDRQNGLTERVSLNDNGQEGNNLSAFPDISANGRYVVFESLASNLVAGDTNGVEDIFVRDRQNGLTERVSVGPAGQESNGQSLYATISDDGRFVTYVSLASNLVANDNNGFEDVFVYDRQNKITERVSVGPAGQESNANSHYPVVSADGHYIVFDSEASNLVSNDSNKARDTFLYDRLTHLLARVSVGLNESQSNGDSLSITFSADARLIVFHSAATNLVAGDNNGVDDVFLRRWFFYQIYLPVHLKSATP